jgi:hypothetical protein
LMGWVEEEGQEEEDWRRKARGGLHEFFID